ncbi:MAG: cytochrome bc complex cytochrome b subunit [Deltaproteobacteria bacterium]|nr:cytochrome bc complex cytochrome b subunit [Deltaproteobacteria bacterium]MCL5277348.1 cytochrome bc complex cytochrome b subunit [Deltaproteobacteria bacterium]
MFKWFDERLDLIKFKEKFLSKTFPTHPTFLIGEIALFSFIILVVTGVFLGLLYEPSTKTVSLFGATVPAAYASVVKIDLMSMGMLVRRIHHWSAMIMIAAVLVHLMRVYFTSAYRNPREVNWFVGLGLFGISLFAAFTGYLLPYSNFSVTATSIGYYIAKSVPWIGNWISRLLFAGDFPSAATVPRFFFLHVMFIPVLLMVLIGLHMVILVKQKHTEPSSNGGRPEAQNGKRLIGIPIWPEQAFISIAFFFFLLFVIALIATYIPLNPIETYGPPSPGTPVMRPDWYFLVVYGFLKLIPGDLSFSIFGGKITPETIGGVVFPTFLILVFLLVPLIDRSKEPQHYIVSPLRRPFMTSFGITGGVFLTMLVVSGYIDVLHIEPKTMLMYVVLATVMAAVVSYALLRLYNKKREG